MKSAEDILLECDFLIKSVVFVWILIDFGEDIKLCRTIGVS